MKHKSPPLCLQLHTLQPYTALFEPWLTGNWLLYSFRKPTQSLHKTGSGQPLWCQVHTMQFTSQMWLLLGTHHHHQDTFKVRNNRPPLVIFCAFWRLLGLMAEGCCTCLHLCCLSQTFGHKNIINYVVLQQYSSKLPRPHNFENDQSEYSMHGQIW